MLEKVQPREQSGRDTLARFRAQVRSAALASLSILEGRGVDRVYCDMHDDFVVRINRDGDIFYTFYQVKTNKKKNHNWTMKEIFGLSSKVKDYSKYKNIDIVDSFAGKLLIHTTNFGAKCESVVFQTNINIEDPIEKLLDDIQSGLFNTKLAKLLAERFPSCFSCPDISYETVKSNLKKLKFETDVQHLKLDNNNFGPIAKEAIYRYSEIDLTHDEFKDILIKLIELVESKSSGVVNDLSESSIEKYTSISISDLLGILSISEAAYFVLANGGDSQAIKNASIIQRTLSDSGANEEQTEFCSRCKIAWDEWFRNNRHILPELEVMSIQSDLAQILRSKMTEGQLNLSCLRAPVENYFHGIENKYYDLSINIILGGVMAELVRVKR